MRSIIRMRFELIKFSPRIFPGESFTSKPPVVLIKGPLQNFHFVMDFSCCCYDWCDVVAAVIDDIAATTLYILKKIVLCATNIIDNFIFRLKAYSLYFLSLFV